VASRWPSSRRAVRGTRAKWAPGAWSGGRMPPRYFPLPTFRLATNIISHKYNWCPTYCTINRIGPWTFPSTAPPAPACGQRGFCLLSHTPQPPRRILIGRPGPACTFGLRWLVRSPLARSGSSRTIASRSLRRTPLTSSEPGHFVGARSLRRPRLAPSGLPQCVGSRIPILAARIGGFWGLTGFRPRSGGRPGRLPNTALETLQGIPDGFRPIFGLRMTSEGDCLAPAPT